MGDDCLHSFSKYLCRCFPQRFVILIFLLLAISNVYFHISFLSLEITRMAPPIINMDSLQNTSDIICGDATSKKNQTQNALLSSCDLECQGIILSSYFWGFMPAYLLASTCINHLGKHALGLGVLGGSIVTSLTPYALRFYNYTTILVWCRLMTGCFEGIVLPSVCSIHRRWILKDSFFTLLRIRTAGVVLGVVAGFSVSAVVLQNFGAYSHVSSLLGGLGIVWWLMWLVLGYASCWHDPLVLENEMTYFQRHSVELFFAQWKVIPWKMIFTARSFWVVVVTELGQKWTWYLLITEVPKYLTEVLNLSVGSAGLWASILFLVYGVSIFFFQFVYVFLQKHFKTDAIRKVCCITGALGFGSFLVLISYSGCNLADALSNAIIAMSFLGSFTVGIENTLQDVSPTYYSTLNEISHAFGVLPATLVPYIVGVITTRSTIKQWRYIAWITFYICATASDFFLIFGSTEIAHWDEVEMALRSRRSLARLAALRMTAAGHTINIK